MPIRSRSKTAKEITIGLANTFHDPAIAIAYEDAIFAEGIERHSQNKRQIAAMGLFYSVRPLKQAIRALGVSDDQEVSIEIRTTWNPPAILRFILDLHVVLASSVQKLWRIDDFASPTQTAGLIQAFAIKATPITAHALRTEVFGARAKTARTLSTDHHLAHAANAVFTSPFSECAVMVIDGSGETASSTFYEFKDNRFRMLHANPNRHSLGFLYARVTALCGFSPIEGEEWKVMGLAAYGKRNDEIKAFFQERTVIRELDVQLRFTDRCFKRLESLVGGFRKSGDPDTLKAADLAHNFQEYFSDITCQLAKNLRGATGLDDLAFAGGCALNSSANGRIVGSSGFRRLHVPSAPGDDGNALGVVLYKKHVLMAMPRKLQAMSPYLGSQTKLDDIERVLAFGQLPFVKCSDSKELTQHVANLLKEGLIVGWMQGQAEFGPRALGNRSILADPRRSEMKNLINAKVKFREEYRPLAPSILADRAHEYFESIQESPYMERTLKFRQEVIQRVPAVVHVDGTGRLQTVRADWNPLYDQLIREFDRLTGVPLVLNTSLNVMGRPIVHGIEDAITLYATTGLDAVVIGPFVLHRTSSK